VFVQRLFVPFHAGGEDFPIKKEKQNNDKDEMMSNF
jgi:hypothetical protein